MSNSFEKYSDVLLDAFRDNSRSFDVVTKKKEILDQLFDHYDCKITDILFIGFNPGILAVKAIPIYVAELSNECQDYLRSSGVEFNSIDINQVKNKKFSVIVALDEYFTFADTDESQKAKVDLLCSICNDFIVTTLRDYKNQDFKDREFSSPISVKSENFKKIYFEHYEYDHQDRNLCYGTNYIIAEDDVIIVGPFSRRNMFFKQLAKFSLDAGAKNFLVHKNLMHKSTIKKNYEHIITIKF